MKHPMRADEIWAGQLHLAQTGMPLTKHKARCNNELKFRSIFHLYQEGKKRINLCVPKKQRSILSNRDKEFPIRGEVDVENSTHMTFKRRDHPRMVEEYISTLKGNLLLFVNASFYRVIAVILTSTHNTAIKSSLPYKRNITKQWI